MGEFSIFSPSFSAFHIVFTVATLLSCCQVESKSLSSNCPIEFSCGNISHVSFPFSTKSRPDCGFLILDCDANKSPTFEVGEDRYEVLLMGNDFTKFFDLVLDKYIRNRSCKTFDRNLPFLNTPLISFYVVKWPSPHKLFRCNHSLDYGHHNFSEYTRYYDCKNFNVFYTKHHSNITGSKPPWPVGCSPIELPFKPFSTSDDLFENLSAEVSLSWKVSEDCLKCHYKSGQCLIDNNNKFYCSKGKRNNLATFCS